MKSAEEILAKYPISRKDGTVSISSAISIAEEYHNQFSQPSISKTVERFTEEEYRHIIAIREGFINFNDVLSVETQYEIEQKAKQLYLSSNIQSDAVEFAEWPQENYYLNELKISSEGSSCKWFKQYTMPDKRKYLSTQELYQLYLQNK